MKFDKAYCKELNRAISPYTARDIYFDEQSQYFHQRLTFLCEDDNCRTSLVAVNIYTEKRLKQALHFRTAPGKTHNSKCDYAFPKETAYGKRQAAQSARGYKRNRYPSELLLERPKKINNINVVAVEQEDFDTEPKRTKTEGTSQRQNTQSPLKTSSLEHLVDCYLNVDKKELENHRLIIGCKKKYFRKFFKRIRYFLDEEGLVYWGKVREIKKYGNNYRVKFQDSVNVDSQELAISIYLESATIEKYRKRRLFRKQLDELVESKEEKLCFFVGAYPNLVKVKYNDKQFLVYEVDIQNLDHLAFTFG